MAADRGRRARPFIGVGLDWLDTAVGWASGLALICVTLTIFFNASGRYLTGWSFIGGEELARLLTVWITFLGAFTLVRREAHVSIDLVLRAMPPGVQRVFRGLVSAIGVATMIYLAWWAWKLCAFSFGTGQRGATLPVLRGFFFLPVLIGSVLMAIGFAEVLLRALTNRLPAFQPPGAAPPTGGGGKR